ncbi:MAG: DUF11 domain-containing protein [Saprospiraceae bacterium]|nr:DUF11 domain-containing protein [Saprospiraceae bacterium]
MEWVGSSYTSNYVLSDTICTGDSVAIPVKLIVLAGGLNIQSYTNHAEINSVKGIVEPNNPYGAVQIGDLDIDSNPDSNPTNDNGADASNAVNNPADNVITGTGGVPMMPGTTPGIDEDDADPAYLPIHDVALIKIRSGSGTVDIGDLITFEIRVYNQGNQSLDSLKVTDYIPAGYSFVSNNGWTASGMNACLDTFLSPIDQVVPGDSISFFIDLTIAPGANNSNLINVAEVTSSRDVGGLTQADDPDSNPDGLASGGGAINTGSDNSTGGNGSGAPGDPNPGLDEDDADPASVQLTQYSIGNIVWLDTNNNGLKDATENGISNVLVILHWYDPVGMVCQAVDSQFTEAMGGYLFDTLIAGKYLVEIAAINFAPGGPLEGYASSSGNGADNLSAGPYEAAPDPDNDIDSDDNGTKNVINFPGSVISDTLDLFGNEPIAPNDTAGLDDNSGTFDINSNLTVDFGFVPMHTIGNQVWIDANNNGLKDASEIGISNVLVILHYYDPIAMSCTAVDSQYTGGTGGYLFDSLIAGKYLLEIAAINFNPGGPLAGYVSSTGNGATDLSSGPYEGAPDPDDDIDNDDNGTKNGNLNFPGSVFSDTLDLFGNEPVAPNDTSGLDDNSGALDINSNLTIDFGFVPLHSIGNQIFVDANNNGKMDLGESAIPGVKVILHYVDTTGGMSVCVTIDSVITDSDGKYVFDSLIAGQYLVEIPASNFGPGQPLENYNSSTGGGATNTTSGPNEVPGMPIDADTPADSVDHGVFVPSGPFAGGVISDTLHLGEDEPINEPFDTTAPDMNSNLHMDFGFFELHSLGNLVWEDANNNGLYDGGETPLTGVIVELHYYNPATMDCELIGYDTTDVNGLYLFDSLLAGKYILALSQSNFDAGGVYAGYVSSTGGLSDLTTKAGSAYDDPASLANDPDGEPSDLDDNGITNKYTVGPLAGLIATDTIDLGDGEPLNENPYNDGTTSDANNNLTIDFGLIPMHSIGNMVWIDANNNGLVDAGEMGIPGVEVVLHIVTQSGCVAVDTQITDGAGKYLFDTLIGGDYIVEITANNFAMGEPLEKYASSTGGGSDLTTKTGSLYEDKNVPNDPDDDTDNDDNGIRGGNTNFASSVTSDTISLNGNEPIAEIDGSTGSTDTTYDMSGARNINSNLTVDFGFVPLHSIGNQIFVDANNNGKMDLGESAIPGVKVILHYVDTTGGMSVCVTIDSVITDSDGKYVFDSLIAGQYLVEIPASNFAPGQPLENYNSSTGGGATNTTSGPNEVPGMPIDADTPADSVDHGVFVSSGPFAGGVISDTLHLGEDEPINEPFDTTAPDMNSNLHMDFGFFELHSLGNLVWEDANNNGLYDGGETPLTGVIVELHYYNPATMDCELIGYDTTDVNGLYLFDSLLAGKYILALSQSNFDAGGVYAGYVSSTGGLSDLTTKAGSAYDDPASLANDPDGEPSDLDDNGITNKYGVGPLAGLIATDTIDLGDGEPLNENPYNDGTTSDANNNLTIDFGLLPMHSIGNLVWIDSNNNGLVDAGEMGIPGVEVVLHIVTQSGCVAVDTQITDGSGKYLFDTLIAGDYIIEITANNFAMGEPLEKYASSTGGGSDLTTKTGSPYEDKNVPNDPDNDTDNDDNGIRGGNTNFASSVTSDTISLNGNEPIAEIDGSTGSTDTTYDMSGARNINSNLTVDFGFVPLHSIGNQIFVDANNNGKMDLGESAIPGVKVILHYVDTTGGMSVCVTIDSVITDSDGKYVFDSLIAGQYLVEIPASNFAPGQPLENYNSSTGGGATNTTSGPNEVPGMPIDADTPADSVDHGVYVPSGSFAGGIIRDTLHLGEDEPTGEPFDTTALDANSNLHIDFGFMEIFSLGNMVWADRNNDGLYDPSREQVISGVVMELHKVIDTLDDENTPVTICRLIGYDTTDANGLYVFDSLLMGRYIVAISGSNFAPGGALAKGFASSTGDGNSFDPVNGPYEDQTNANWMDQTTDNNDNGSLMNAPGSAIDGLIASDTIDLGDAPEPLTENPYNDTTVTDDHNNLTIDFGLIPLNSIGNQVWWDANNNGLYDRGTEIPLDSVEVVLHWYNEDAMSCVALDTVLTDATGRYLFGYLLEGKYIIEITASIARICQQHGRV